jgi:26S proteasome regulatory subunit N2
MRQYACETQHDKIQRGLRMGIACLGYGRLEGARPHIDALLRDPSNAVLRQTGVLMMALAYVGSGNARVLQDLLERVANDPNNDVKRFAAIALGFVLCKYINFCKNR